MTSDTVVEYNILCSDDVDLVQMLHKCTQCVASLLKEYIWQKDEFKLHISDDEASLMGSTNVGENINDEWFIVYLLLHLSKEKHDIVVRLEDSDGDFLLIEAAEHLPKWMKPDSTVNRVFIQNGNLHIIPYPCTPAEVTSYPAGIPTLQQAYQIICDDNICTIANSQIQKSINRRVKEYPEKLRRDFHRAHCVVPEEVAYILQQSPKLVAVAVQAFYNRDQLDVKVCRKLENFNPIQQIKVNVKFTRHLYCQLEQAQFLPDRKSKWALPACSDVQYKAKELGFKLACGFEILISRYNSLQNDGEPCGKKWHQYLSNLQKNDFFQNELEGSKKYKQLLEEAKQHFKENVNDSMDTIGEEILRLLREAPSNRSHILKRCENIQPEDSVDWMTVSPTEFDEMMMKFCRDNDHIPLNTNIQKKTETENLTNLVDNMKLFVDNVSSYEGVEIPEEKPSQQQQQQQQLNTPHTMDDIDFDATKFMECIRGLLNPLQTSSTPSTSTKKKEDDNDTDDEDDDDDEEEIDDDFISCDHSHEINGDGFHDIMDKMDDELRGTNMPKSFQDGNQDADDELNYDVNLIKNFLESFSSQDGLSGPVSNIMQSMGFSLPPPNQDV